MGRPNGEGRRPEECQARTELDWGHGVLPSRSVLAGETTFASAEAQVQRVAELLGEGALVVHVPSPSASARGKLHELVDDLLERELERMGAPSPYLAAWSTMPDDADARLSDQLFRARTVGATGIAVAFGSLAQIAAPALTLEDSATLRWLARAAGQAPLAILLDDSDTKIGAYAAPVALDSLLGAEPPPPPTRADATEAAAPLSPAAPAPADEAPLDHGAEATAPDDVTETDSVVAPAEPAPEPAAQEPAERPKPGKRARATVGVPVSGPTDAWRTWAVALAGARGPQPLATFERLFAESYVPLANAIASGVDDGRALRAYDEFRRSFERSYADAFATFALTNRRPRLVMDAYDLASKQARLANARATHVLVVDSMRYDVGCLVRDAIARDAAGVASLTSETVLWSALPTTTMRQLETLARGIDALRSPVLDEPSESLRGRSAEMVRRMRVGSRELYKLDLVPALLGTVGEDVVSSLPEIAAAVADALVRHIHTLAPRTLLYVVGDHGFTVDRRGDALHGGASPEEVLVPAQAWLVGELH